MMSVCELLADESKLCILHKDQIIIFVVNGNMYYGSMKMIYQTFHDKNIHVFTAKKEWAPAQIVGRPCNETLIRINNSIDNSLICAENTVVLCEQGFKPVKLLSKFDKIGMPIFPHWESPAFLPDAKINLVDITYLSITDFEPAEDDWLFGIKFLGPDNSYTLKNGIVVSAGQ